MAKSYASDNPSKGKDIMKFFGNEVRSPGGGPVRVSGNISAKGKAAESKYMAQRRLEGGKKRSRSYG